MPSTPSGDLLLGYVGCWETHPLMDIGITSLHPGNHSSINSWLMAAELVAVEVIALCQKIVQGSKAYRIVYRII